MKLNVLKFRLCRAKVSNPQANLKSGDFGSRLGQNSEEPESNWDFWNDIARAHERELG